MSQNNSLQVINLQKGGKISLEKEAPGVEKLSVALGWVAGDDYDLDVSAFLLNGSERLENNTDFIFYRNLKHSSGGITHTGDVLSSTNSGDIETINLELNKIPAYIEEISIIASIHEFDKKHQTFGQVRKGFIRIYETETKREIARYDLAEEFSRESAIIFGRIYRYQSTWKFDARGEGKSDGLQGFVDMYTRP